MTFLVPAFLWAAAGVALGVVALHFLVTREPKTDLLPTVRFFPDVPVRSTTVAIRPSDLLLLALRVLLILLVGAAFAQPQLTPKREAVARVIGIDVSRAVGSAAELADSARRYTAGAAAVVWFDSVAHEVEPGAVADSLATLAASDRRVGAAPRGVLSSALVAMLRAASRVREQGDSLELILVSPLAEEERDAATATVRALFPGHLRLVPVAAARDTAPPQQVRLAWADSGAAGWTPRASADTVGAVRAGEAVMVYPFVRRWRLTAPEAGARVSARWVDGEPAAVETRRDGGCVRSIGLALPSAGDAVLRPDYERLATALSGPCGVPPRLTPLPPAALAELAGPPRLAPASAVAPRLTRTTPLVPWLLAAALLLALLELVVRRMSGAESASDRVGAAATSPTEKSSVTRKTA